MFDPFYFELYSYYFMQQYSDFLYFMYKIIRRSEQIMMDLILQIAKTDERIRAVILSGSRTDPYVKKDCFQDYDITYLVTEVEPFVNNRGWIKTFGDILIMQMPDLLDEKWPQCNDKFTYLMQFQDGNRIDLTFLHCNKVSAVIQDSQSLLLLDKDGLVGKLAIPSHKSYLPKPPTEKELTDCCNEFLWVSLYVAKGICRKQLIYTKTILEQIVRKELIKLLTWYAAIRTNFEKPMGLYGKYLEQYLPPKLWNKFISTYVDADYENLWKALLTIIDLFNEVAIEIAQHYNYHYNDSEYKNVINYLKLIGI